MNNDNDVAPPKRKTLTMADKKAAYSMIVALCIDGEPPRSAFSIVAAYFSVHRTTTARLWKQIQNKLQNDAVDTPNDIDNDDEEPDNILLDKNMPDAAFETKIANRRKGKVKHDRDEIKAKIKNIPYSKRRCTRMLAAQLEMPQSTWMYIQKEAGSVFR